MPSKNFHAIQSLTRLYTAASIISDSHNADGRQRHHKQRREYGMLQICKHPDPAADVASAACKSVKPQKSKYDFDMKSLLHLIASVEVYG